VRELISEDLGLKLVKVLLLFLFLYFLLLD